MPTTIYDSSLLTKRRQAKTIANSFLQRLNTQGTVNQTTSYGPLLGVYDSSIMNEVKNGTIQYIEKCDGGSTAVDPGCCPAPVYGIPGPVSSFFIYLNCVIVTWAAPANSAGPIAYNITATSSDGGVSVSDTSNTNSYSFNTLTPFKTYTFTVVAYNNSGYSALVTSYSIYAPPNALEGAVGGLSITSNGNVWGAGSSAGQNNFTKENWSDKYQCYGSIKILENTYPTIVISTVFGLSDLVGYITTHDSNAAPGVTSGVWKTTDGGLSWNSVTEGKIFLVGNPFPDFSYWWNESDGFVLADSDGISTTCVGYYTTNGGTTWTASTGITGGEFSFAGNQVYSVVGDTIWFISKTYSGDLFVHKSTNKGQSFTTQFVFSSQQFNGYISFRDLNVGVVYTNSEQNLYRTADGGATWTQVLESDLTAIGADIIINACMYDLIDPATGYINPIWLIGQSIINGYLQNTTYLIKDIFASPLDVAQTSNLDTLSSIVSRDNYIYGTRSGTATIKSSNTDTLSPPQLVAAYRGNQSVLLNIDAPDSISITQFNIEIYQGDTLIETRQILSYPILITGLTNGISYRFKAAAVQSDGEEGGVSGYTEFTEAIIPSVGVPVPTTFSSIGFSGTSNTFTGKILPPANDGGSPVIDYTVVLTQANGYIETVTGITTPLMTVDLPSASSISTARVFARNSSGTQTESLRDFSISRVSTPVVTINSITDTNTGEITIDVTSNNGSPIQFLSYTVGIINRVSFEPITSCTPNLYEVISVTGPSQNIIITGLNPGTVQVSVLITNLPSAAKSAGAIQVHTVL